MPDDHTDTPPAAAGVPPGANGTHPPPAADPRVEAAKLRARCSNLRHWCRNLLTDPAADGVLPAALAADLRDTPPAMSEMEAHDLFLRLATGEPVPPTHPVFAAPARTGADVAGLAAERERLREAFFTLYDHLYPDDVPTEEELLREMQYASERSISDILAELEQELAPRAEG